MKKNIFVKFDSCMMVEIIKGLVTNSHYGNVNESPEEADVIITDSSNGFEGFFGKKHILVVHSERIRVAVPEGCQNIEARHLAAALLSIFEKE